MNGYAPAKCLGDAPSPETLHEYLTRLWRERGGILVYPDRQPDPAVRAALIAEAERRYGPRST